MAGRFVVGYGVAFNMLDSIRVALVHDWLTGMRGGEKVLEVFAQLFPEAPIYTMVHKRGSVSAAIESHPIRTSALQKLPGAVDRYRYYLPLMPRLVERMSLEPVDLVLSVSSCVAKSIVPPGGARHASYVLSPMRYLYDRYDDYFAPGRSSLATRWAMRLVRRRLQRWDIDSARRVDSMVGISRFVAARIRSIYGREAPVIYPPVDIARFRAAQRRRHDDYYLIVSALVPYKNVDIAIEAFRRLDRRLVVAGSGPLFQRLAARCPRNVELLGWVDDARIPALVAGCRAFIFPSVEDFGIAPVEAMAAGRPVIALGEGGALDTIRDLDGTAGPHGSPTGLFYHQNTAERLADAVRRFETVEERFQPPAIADWASRFDRPRFEREIRYWLASVVAARRAAA